MEHRKYLSFKIMAKNPIIREEKKEYHFEIEDAAKNRRFNFIHTGTYALDFCIVTSITAWPRGRKVSKRRRKSISKIFIFCQNKREMSIKCHRNCKKTIMDILLNFGPNREENEEEMTEKSNVKIMVVEDKMADPFFSNQENERKIVWLVLKGMHYALKLLYNYF